MINPYKINLKGTETTTEKAIINMFNLLSEDIVNGSIKQVKIDVEKNKEEQKKDHQSNVDELFNVNDLIIELAGE